ncbi:hypothetical protein F5888DRAFT_1802346 [Russula emetica]|nr:hypothetical protein F5888DRAFT_1806809 [Russula emetica]KAF8499892.1 hypothetical protein F5888DRAFT_1802346 [Russula emetica]
MPELTRVSTLNMIRPYALRSALSSSARLSFAPLIGQRLSLYLKPHKYGTHGIVSSTAASSEDDESEELFPDRPSTPLSKHCEGLRMQQRKRRLLPRSPHSGSVKKRKRTEPVPRYAFPHVVEKASCDELKERSPWTFDAILAVAGEIKSGNNPGSVILQGAGRSPRDD